MPSIHTRTTITSKSPGEAFSLQSIEHCCDWRPRISTGCCGRRCGPGASTNLGTTRTTDASMVGKSIYGGMFDDENFTLKHSELVLR